MPFGIAKKAKSFVIIEFESYEKIPLNVVMPHPRHNTNSNKIEPVKFNPKKQIQFYWIKPFWYTTPFELTISYYGETIEHIKNAQIERVKEALEEYSKLTRIQILNKHVAHLKSEQLELKQKEKTLKKNMKMNW